MKKHIVLIMFLSALAYRAAASIVQTDPVLAGAIYYQADVLNKAYEDRKKLEESIMAAETAHNLALENITEVERKTQKYMSNVSAFTQHLPQIEQAINLITKIIPRNYNRLRTTAKNSGAGQVVMGLAEEQIRTVGSEIAPLITVLTQLVTNDSFDIMGNAKNEAHKVNYLNSAERYQVVDNILSRLRRLNSRLVTLEYQIRTVRARDVVKTATNTAENVMIRRNAAVQNTIERWKNLKK